MKVSAPPALLNMLISAAYVCADTCIYMHDDGYKMSFLFLPLRGSCTVGIAEIDRTADKLLIVLEMLLLFEVALSLLVIEHLPLHSKHTLPITICTSIVCYST